MFVHAPPPTLIEGQLAVPMHVTQLRANVMLDARMGTGLVEALLNYQLGPTAGRPIFDLRQTIGRAWLDGHAIPVARLRSRDTGEGPNATVRIVDVSQAAATHHQLRLRYRLQLPQSDLGGAYPPVLRATGPGRLRWSVGMGDLVDGRHLEMWFPTNLPFDQFPFELRIKLVGAATRHTLVTNGRISSPRVNQWHVQFPGWFTSVSHLLEFRPTDELEHLRVAGPLPASGRWVVIDLWKPTSQSENLRAEAARVARMLTDNEHALGRFVDDRYTCFFHGAGGGMEYAAGATTSASALAHEVLHAWFARGVMPASDVDGWWDEAFTTYRADAHSPERFDFTRRPVALCSRRPFQRHTDPGAYEEGSRLFRGFAEMLGAPLLLRSMAKLFSRRAKRCLSTTDLEQHLVLDTGEVRVVDAFHRFVYGFEDSTRRSGVRFERVSLSDGPDGRTVITARVVNDRDADTCRHFLLLFSDLSGRRVAAMTGFDLRPGEIRTVRVRVSPGAIGAGQAVVGAVHVRLFHPSGQAIDYRECTVMRSDSRRRVSGQRELEPVRWLVG